MQMIWEIVVGWEGETYKHIRVQKQSHRDREQLVVTK